MSIALYTMFSLKKRFAKLCIISGNRTHDLMHTARLRWPLHHQRLCRHKFVHGISLSARTRLHCGKNVTLRLVSDILRGAHRATRTGHGVTSLGLPGPGPDSEVRALRLLRLVTGLELEMPSVLAARPSAMRVPSQTAGTRLLKPDWRHCKTK